MDPEDDVVYKKSVRNMSIVLAAIVITIFAALIIPPIVNPQHDNFQKSVSLPTSQSLTIHLSVNSTSLTTTERVDISAWAVSTSGSIHNITAQNDWPAPQSELWTTACPPGSPLGVGVMRGHYDQNNYSLGTLLSLKKLACNLQGAPGWFAFEPNSTKALVTVNGTPGFWNIQTEFIFGGGSSYDLAGSVLPAGVYTAVAVDEWGDVLTTNFRVSS
jgi:hypothetical protein